MQEKGTSFVTGEKRDWSKRDKIRYESTNSFPVQPLYRLRELKPFSDRTQSLDVLNNTEFCGASSCCVKEFLVHLPAINGIKTNDNSRYNVRVQPELFRGPSASPPHNPDLWVSCRRQRGITLWPL